jgi:ATP-dependent DNA helicase PIF1
MLTSVSFPTRMEVENANGSRMKNLDGRAMTFHATDTGSQDPIQRAKTLSNFMAQEVLTLKKGAQVMLIKNIDSQLVNGSTGKVIAFMNENDFRVYTDNEEMYNQAHEPEDVGDEEQNRINAKARIAIQAARNKNETPGKIYPMVRFTLQDNTSRDLLCVPEEFKTEAPGGEIIARRMQVPLILAWALSIHKAQGQTLERVKVNLGKVFERGQAYVALSRATSQSGLQVNNFDPRKVMVHPKVIDFYSKLTSIDTALEKNGKSDAQAELVGYNEQDFASDDDDHELRYMHG